SPRYIKAFDGHNALHRLQPLLHEVSRTRDLHNLILLVIPPTTATATATSQLKLHCFESDTMKHLGSTCITPAELLTMQQYQMLLKYEIVYSRESLSIRSLACNPAVIARLVAHSKLALLEHKEPEPEPEPSIKSLRMPRIPVRMLNLNNKSTASNDEKKPSWKI
ncbi:hypothetical protein KR044_012586, partial [Drosophila immigrans]